MINGAHVVLYTSDPEADRAFFRDILKFSCVDAGHGWLIFALPAAEAAFHNLDKETFPRDDAQHTARHELILMCDDLADTLRELQQKQVQVSAVSEQRWGKLASLTLPGGSKLGIYEPTHPRP